MIKTRTQSQTKGFSVVELLIALGLGLLVVAGIVQLFVGNSRTYEIVNAQARLQENARFAFEFISRPARTAGFYGCAPELENVVWHPVGTAAQAPEYNMSEAVDGWDSNDDGTYAPDDLTTLPRTEGGTNTNVHIAGNGIDRNDLQDSSDILVFRTVRQPFAGLAQTLQPNADPVVSTPGGEPAFAVNDMVVVSDCEQAALFRVTGVTPGVNETTLARGTGTGAFDNDVNINNMTNTITGVPSTLSLIGRSYGASAIVGVFESFFFFIAESAEVDNQGNPVFALWQKAGSAAPVELVQGVEDMQVWYGVDTTNDNQMNVDQYQTIDDVVNVNQIVAVQVRLQISSVDTLAELNNQRLTRTFTKTIHVRNG